MNEIAKQSRKQQQQDREPPQKKQKFQQSFLQHYVDDSTSLPKVDESIRYLSMEINKSTLTDNPLDFWRINQANFPVLSKIARQIHCKYQLHHPQLNVS